jgi:phosphatidylinositol-3-phosphatase
MRRSPPVASRTTFTSTARQQLRAARIRLLRLGLLCIAVCAAATAAGAGATSSGAGKASPIPRFRHVILIVFENREIDDVLGNSEAPTFNRLASRYATLANYTAVAHPSLPNYLALVSGSTHGIDSDCTTCLVDANSLADTLQASRKTWKTYAEGLPSVGFTGVSSGRYAKKHVPFLYFRRNLTPARLRRIVPLTQFLPDLRRKRLPAFSLVVPDLCHDMHDCGVATGDTWLSGFTKPLLRGSALRRSVVFILFDEGTTDDGRGGHIPALAIGSLVRRHASLNAPVDHYGLLRTIEEGLRLPPLGLSAGARSITGIWRR